MTDQTLPSFDPETPSQEVPAPRKPRPRPTRRPKSAKRAAPALKPAKRVPKKRRVRKTGKHPALAAPYGGGSQKTDTSWGALFNSYILMREILEKHSPEARAAILGALAKLP